jgi:hypothetical protein
VWWPVHAWGWFAVVCASEREGICLSLPCSLEGYWDTGVNDLGFSSPEVPFTHCKVVLVSANTTFVRAPPPLGIFCLQITKRESGRLVLLQRWNFFPRRAYVVCHFTKYLQTVLATEVFWVNGSFFLAQASSWLCNFDWKGAGPSQWRWGWPVHFCILQGEIRVSVFPFPSPHSQTGPNNSLKLIQTRAVCIWLSIGETMCSGSQEGFALQR